MPEPTLAPDTPLIRRILTLVARTCDPRAPRWAGELARALGQALHSPLIRPPMLTVEDWEIVVARVTALEAEQQAPPSSGSGSVPNRY